MKVAFIIDTFPNLSQTFILNQITGLLDLGHEVDIFARTNPHDKKVHRAVKEYRLMERTYYFDMPDGKVRRFFKCFILLLTNFHKDPLGILKALSKWRPVKGIPSIRVLYAFISFLGKTQRFDVIHCHFGTNGILGASLKQLGVRGKLVVAFHGFDMSTVPSQQDQNIYHKVFEVADLLMPISNYWKEKLIEMGASPKKVFVHRMGIDPQRFQFRQRSYQVDQVVRLLTVGRLVEKKGVEYGIRAVSLLFQKHPKWLLRYNIVGGGGIELKVGIFD